MSTKFIVNGEELTLIQAVRQARAKDAFILVHVPRGRIFMLVACRRCHRIMPARASDYCATCYTALRVLYREFMF